MLAGASTLQAEEAAPKNSAIDKQSALVDRPNSQGANAQQLNQAAANELSSRPTQSAPLNLGSGELVKIGTTLLLVIGVILLLAWLVKRTGIAPQFNPKAMKVVSSLSIGSKEKLVLMQVGEEQILLGVTPHSINKLHQLPEMVHPQTPSMPTASFAKTLDTLLKRGR